MSYEVRWSIPARADLRRLFEFVLDRELTRENGDLDLADRGIAAIEQSIHVLERSPFTCRKSDDSPFMRELVIPFGRSGFVALFDILDSATVVIVAVRHQREDDYH